MSDVLTAAHAWATDDPHPGDRAEIEALIAANPGKSIPELMPQVLPLWEKYQIARET